MEGVTLDLDGGELLVDDLELSLIVAAVKSSVDLEAGAGSCRCIAQHQQQLELESLSTIVEQLNDRFGLGLTEADQLLFDQFNADWVADQELSDQAHSNTIENFKLAFDRKFMHTIVARMDSNSDIFKRVLDDDEFSDILREYYLRKVYTELREPA